MNEEKLISEAEGAIFELSWYRDSLDYYVDNDSWETLAYLEKIAEELAERLKTLEQNAKTRER